MGRQQLDQRFVHLSGQHLLHNLHGLFIRIAHPVDKPALFADLFQHSVDLRAAAVHQHHIDTQRLHHDDIVHHGIFQVLVDHGIAAVFDHDGLPGQALDVRQGLYQDLGPAGIGNFHRFHFFLLRCGSHR